MQWGLSLCHWCDQIILLDLYQGDTSLLGYKRVKIVLANRMINTGQERGRIRDGQRGYQRSALSCWHSSADTSL